MKRPPLLIIINLILLTGGYLYCSYSLIDAMINAIQASVILLFLTFGIVATFIAVFTHHARSILSLGLFLLLIGMFILGGLCSESYNLKMIIIFYLFLITGILFVIWGIILYKDSRTSENISATSYKKYKYLLYMATFFCVIGTLSGLGGSVSRNYESFSGIMFQIMGWLFFTGIMQFVVYYILCRRRELIEKKANSPEPGGNLQE